MALEMAKNSLFAILLRSPWWYSTLIALFFIVVSLLLVSPKYMIFGFTAALPFLGISAYSGYLQSKRPGKKRMLEVVESARKMSAKQLAARISSQYEKHNFDITPFKGSAADFDAERGRHKFLVCCKRFKAASTGIEPLKQLVESGGKMEATGYLYVALGSITENARTYARQNDIELIQAEALTEFFDGTRQVV